MRDATTGPAVAPKWRTTDTDIGSSGRTTTRSPALAPNLSSRIRPTSGGTSDGILKTARIQGGSSMGRVGLVRAGGSFKVERRSLYAAITLMRRTALALAIILAACDDPIVAADYQLLEPPPETFLTWYQEAEECAGKPGAFWKVRWFSATAIHMPDPSGEWRAWGGMFVPPTDIIIRSDHLDSAGAVRHESLHHIIGFDVGHDHPAFEECG